MANSADPDQLASSEANCSGSTLQRQDISGFSRTRVNVCAAAWDETRHSICKNKGSGEPAHPSSLARICAVCTYKWLTKGKRLLGMHTEKWLDGKSEEPFFHDTFHMFIV